MWWLAVLLGITGCLPKMQLMIAVMTSFLIIGCISLGDSEICWLYLTDRSALQLFCGVSQESATRDDSAHDSVQHVHTRALAV